MSEYDGKKQIWFVAAGTGGHIFPGLALAREMQRRDGGLEALFFGTRDRLEAKLVPEAGFPMAFLVSGAWKGKGLLGRVGSLLAIAWGFLQVWGRLLRGRPRALVSVGGYVSVPTALAGRAFGVPLYILEPNIRAGLANRVLSRLAVRAYAAPGSDARTALHCPVEELGNPVREDLRPNPLRERVTRLLVLGGSQGARALCQASLWMARDAGFRERGVQLILQTGERNLKESEALKTELGLGAEVELLPFIRDIPSALEAADLVVARAGAMTVAELAVAGVPTIFVPFPFAADDHQRVNAEILAKAGACRVIDERQPAFESRLSAAITELAWAEDATTARRALAESFRRFARPRATAEIAQQILSLSASRG
jgi:UDP-N-acetylglucosamine--N-acetylmuramyl-(pentapeptide) pyrophosphoryl-undecaprenol N-acetylglucosamine transferase